MHCRIKSKTTLNLLRVVEVKIKNSDLPSFFFFLIIVIIYEPWHGKTVALEIYTLCRAS